MNNKNSAEENITNFGFVPEGISFAKAIEKIKSKRKYFINPNEGGHRLTICDTLRATYLETEKLSDTKEKEQIKEYLAQAYDFSKRMDARMKYLKSILDENKISYIKNN